MTQIEALARRAAAAGVAIQTLSSFAVGENALAGIVLGYGGIATTDIQEGLRSTGEMLRPIGARRDDHSSVAR